MCHDIYKDWFEKVAKEEGNYASCVRDFIKFFECVQVRSVSEAICETVGSVMSNKTGRGRVLDPINFDKEVFLEMNLGPIHLLEPLVDEVYIRRQKKYMFETNAKGLFVSGNKLKDKQLGAAVHSKRDSEEKKSRIPKSFWTGDIFKK